MSWYYKMSSSSETNIVPSVQLNSLGYLTPEDTLCISIAVTSRCNLHCSYCHYNSRITSHLSNADIEDDVFDHYLKLIDWIRSTLHENIQIRFSGGEPLLLGDRLFRLAEKVYSRLGETVHVLSNGVLVNSSTVKSSSSAGISAFLLSIENPYDVDKGSINPVSVIDKIISFNNDVVQVQPAVVIVRNHEFYRLTELMDWFYDKIKKLPTVSELNFSSFIQPTGRELNYLSEEVAKIVKKYIDKTPVVLFPYIVPDLAYCYENKYLIEFGVAPDHYNFSHSSMTDCTSEIIRYLNDAYPESKCNKFDCSWREGCKRVKWVWENNLQNYCAMRTAICEGYYKGCF